MKLKFILLIIPLLFLFITSIAYADSGTMTINSFTKSGNNITLEYGNYNPPLTRSVLGCQVFVNGALDGNYGHYSCDSSSVTFNLLSYEPQLNNGDTFQVILNYQYTDPSLHYNSNIYVYATPTPSNAKPVVNFSGASINKGDTYTTTGSFTDPDSTSWTGTVDYGDGSGVQPLTLTGQNFTLNHMYTFVGSFTVNVDITDNQGATGVGTAGVSVNPVGPVTGGTMTINSFSLSGTSNNVVTLTYGDYTPPLNEPILGCQVFVNGALDNNYGHYSCTYSSVTFNLFSYEPQLNDGDTFQVILNYQYTDPSLHYNSNIYTYTVPTPTPTVTPTPSLVSAINAGGDTQGNFVADTDNSGGQPYSSTATVDTSNVINPAPQAVYQTVRYGNFTYTIPNLTAGASYTVRLHFNELYWNSAGSRVFNVAINGANVLNNFDIYQTAGGANIANIQQFPTTADANGNITIRFTTVTDNAMVNGIELYSGTLPSPTPTPTPTPTSSVSINAGGGSAGSFLSDEDFSGGQSYTSTATVDTNGVTSPAPQTVYQSVRYGNFTYIFPNLYPNTTYTVKLHFNELYWGTALAGGNGGTGSRVFNTTINGQQVLTNYDIFQDAGGANKAIVKQFTTTADANGKITIGFTTVTDNAMVNGVEIYQ